MAGRRPFIDFQEVKEKVSIPDALEALFGIPPLERMNARALDIYSSPEECPANFKAK